MNVAKGEAQRVLLEHGCTELPVRVYSLCERMGIRCKLCYTKEGNDGCCGIRKKIAYIFINKVQAPFARSAGGGTDPTT